MSVTIKGIYRDPNDGGREREIDIELDVEERRIHRVTGDALYGPNDTWHAVVPATPVRREEP